MAAGPHAFSDFIFLLSVEQEAQNPEEGLQRMHMDCAMRFFECADSYRDQSDPV